MMDPITPAQAESDSVDLDAMLHSPGWKIMREEGEDLIRAWMRRLINSNDERESFELKTKIRQMEWLLFTPAQFIAAARRAKEEGKGDSTGQEADLTAV